MRAAAALVVLALLAVACGGGTSTGQPPGSTKVVATDFKFDPSALSFKAGKVVIYLRNDGPSAHDIVVADSSGHTVARSDLLQPGDAAVFTIADLPAGSYTFYCDVPGHKGSGMIGTITSS